MIHRLNESHSKTTKPTEAEQLEMPFLRGLEILPYAEVGLPLQLQTLLFF